MENLDQEYKNLIELKNTYKQKLKDIKEKISNHPATLKKNIENGIKALECLTQSSEEDEIEIDETILLNYIESIEHGIEEFRAGATCNCNFICINDFNFEITINVHHCHEEYEVTIVITNNKRNINKRYNDIIQNEEYNYDKFVKEFGLDSSEFHIFQPFFKIDDNCAYEYVMC